MSQTPDQEKPPTPEDRATTWLARLEAGTKAGEKFRKRGEKITRIYRSEADAVESEEVAQFNIFWSNVEILGPATYSRRPKVEVFRRFHDQDPTARLAGQILERGLQYEIDCKQDFHHTMRLAVKDRLLPGLGQAWVRYEPTFKKEPQNLPGPDGQPVMQEVELLSDEFTPIDYVFWQDLIVSPARTWADVRWIARLIPFSRAALKKRFTEAAKEFKYDLKDVPFDLDATREGESDEQRSAREEPGADSDTKRAGVYEVWDRETREILFFVKGLPVPLDIKTDQLQLDEFFVCPRPLLATTTNDRFLPVADYVFYQRQIRELDLISRRIDVLVRDLRLVGVYDATQDSLKEILGGGHDNKMIPVTSWAAFAERGGLKAAVDFLPIDQVVKILQSLYSARDQLKQVVYEITGMADIVRGASQASETLGAQEIKAKFANLRLSSRQQQVAEFVTSILRIKAEIMCRRYAPETLIRISSAGELEEVKRDLERLSQQQAQEAQQQAMAGMPPPMPGQPAPPPPQIPPPPPITDPLQSPLVQKALQLLKDERLRHYRIEVASDSMIELDEVDERQRRTEFMSAVSNFFNGMKNVTAVGPEMVPVALEMLRFIVRGYSVGRALESTIEEATLKIRQRMEQPPAPPPPEPAVEVAKIRTATDKEISAQEIASKERIAEADRQLEKTMQDAKLAFEGYSAALEKQAEQHKAEREAWTEAQKQAMERGLRELEMRMSDAQHARGMASDMAKNDTDSRVEKLAESQQAILDQIAALAKLAQRTRKKIPVYNAAGDITEVQEVLGDEE
jgi:hypothetical protein